jgi:hypothetical protein
MRRRRRRVFGDDGEFRGADGQASFDEIRSDELTPLIDKYSADFGLDPACVQLPEVVGGQDTLDLRDRRAPGADSDDGHCDAAEKGDGVGDVSLSSEGRRVFRRAGQGVVHFPDGAAGFRDRTRPQSMAGLQDGHFFGVNL